jgi:hypothetical protein
VKILDRLEKKKEKEKKCLKHLPNLSARPEATAILVIARLEVLEAKIAPGFTTLPNFS